MNEVNERLVDGDAHNQYAPCRFCGQLYITHGTVEYDRRELERIGTGQCNCPAAVKERKKAGRRQKAEKVIRDWIPNNCDEQQFIMTLVDRILTDDNMMVNITAKYADDTQITIKEMNNGNIRLTIKQGRKAENEI